MSQTDNLLLEKKIDYIYNELKAQKRRRYFSLFLKFILVGLIIFAYFIIFPKLDKDKVMSTFSENIIKIVKPITQSLVNDLVNNENINNTQNNSTEILLKKFKDNPDLLNNLLK